MSDTQRRPWSADAELTAEGAARLIAARFPGEMPEHPRIERLGSGWDNVAYLVEGRWVFRFPRREPAAQCMRNEIASLPRLEHALPIAVPRITYVCEAADGGYPYPFAGYELIEGRTACSVAWSEAERARCARPLGRFLAALHGLPVPADAPEDPAGDKDVAMLVEKTLTALARFEELAEGGGTESEALARSVRERVRALARTPEWSGEARWVHGDLYARHILVDERREPCGVIDWGDVHAGETADDLSIAFAFLPRGARREFFAAYGEVDEASADRARLYALHSGAVVSAYGWEIRDRVLVEMGRATLELATQ